MRLLHFPLSIRWMFVMGDDVATATIIRLDGYPRGFATRAEAVAAAKTRRLSVDRHGVVTALAA